MTQQSLNFVKEKETKNTVKFNEKPAPGSPPVVGVLYVQKWFAGQATSLKLTIAVEQSAILAA